MEKLGTIPAYVAVVPVKVLINLHLSNGVLLWIPVLIYLPCGGQVTQGSAAVIYDYITILN